MAPADGTPDAARSPAAPSRAAGASPGEGSTGRPSSPAPPPPPEAAPRRGAPWRERDWGWRHRIRRDPAAYRVYRTVVGVIGGLLVLLSVLTGWLPGPGGIPLFLLGLAVLASEFHWARRLLDRAKAWAHDAAERGRRRPRWQRWSGGAALLVMLAAGAWTSLRVLGLPGWLPDRATALLGSVPGLG